MKKEYLSLLDVSNIMQQKLNDISDYFFKEELIEKNIQFLIKDNSKLQKGQTYFNSEKFYTVGVLKRIDDTVPENYFSGIYDDLYEINIYGYLEERDDLEKILDYFYITENERYANENIDGWNINKAVKKWRFESKFNALDGSGKTRVYYRLPQITWSYTLGGTNSKIVKLLIDDVPCDWLKIDFQEDKSLLPNVAFNSNAKSDIATTDRLVINLPFQVTNDKNKELFNEVRDKSFNNKHKIKIVFFESKEETIALEEDFTIRQGNIVLVNINEPIYFQIVLYHYNERCTFKIDGEEVRLLSYEELEKNNIEPITSTTDEIVENTFFATDITYESHLRILVEGNNQKSLDLLKDHKDESVLNKLYSISETLYGITTNRTLKVTQSRLSYSEDNGQLLELSVVKFTHIFAEVQNG